MKMLTPTIRKLLGVYNDRSIIVALFVLLILSILYEFIVYHIGLITGDYYKILNEKNSSAFYGQTAKSIGLIVAISLAKSLKEYCASFLYVSWRQALTLDLHRLYFDNLCYFRLNVLQVQQHTLESNPEKARKNDNVDQRITQDVDKMFESLSILIPELLVAPFIITFYWYKCQKATGWIGPIGCLIFFVIGTVVNQFFIRRVSRYVYTQEKCEGDFRFQHLRIRNDAESIAFLSGEAMEKQRCDKYLSTLINTQYWLIFNQFWLKSSMYLCDYFGSILSFISLAFPLFAGHYDDLSPGQLSQLISQNAFFTMYLINCFTRIIDLANNFSTFLGTSSRIKELHESLLNLTQYNQTNPKYNLCGTTNQHLQSAMFPGKVPFVNLQNVSIRTPLMQNIIENLNLNIESKTNLLITGPSGAGKTSLLRCIKGIWPIHRGIIHRNGTFDSPNFVMFLSHKPVLTTGSIAEQIIYPLIYNPKEWTQDDSGFQRQVKDILKFLDLENCVLKRVNYDVHRDLNINWQDHLSAGEIQRFNLARIFYHRPRIVFLDECTTALPEEMEERIFEEMLKRYLMTVVSCGHRSSIRRFHQQELQIINPKQFNLITLRNNLP